MGPQYQCKAFEIDFVQQKTIFFISVGNFVVTNFGTRRQITDSKCTNFLILYVLCSSLKN